MSVAPSRRHQKISGVLFGNFFNYFKGKPCEVYDAPFDVVLPDKGTDDWRDSVNVVQPDLVVEIISPYTSKKDIKEKFDLYEREVVREYWIVYPGDRAVQVFSLTDEGYFDEGRIFDLSRRRVGAAQAAQAPEAAESSGPAVNSVLFPDLLVPLVELFAE